jgi:PAS domain S-box-containing protein
MKWRAVSDEGRGSAPLPDLQSWRERTVHVILWTVLLASIIPLFFILLQVLQVYHDWVPLVCILVVYFCLLVPLCVCRRIDYRVRAWGLILVGYAMAVLGFVRGGLVGEGRLYLLALPPVAIALMGVRAGIVSCAFSLLTYGWFLVVGPRGLVPSVIGHAESQLPPSVWFGSAAGFTMFLVAVTLVLALLITYLQRALAQARAEAVKSRAILEGIADGVIVFDNDWRVSGANPAVAELLGRPIDELVGYDIETLMGSGDVDVDAATWMAMQEMIEMGEPAQFEWADKTFSASLAQVREPSGAVVGNVAVLRDVTREAEVQRARESLFAVAAHELRTPLNAVINFAKLMQDGLVPSHMRQETVARIIANAERLLLLANNLLERARLEAGEVRLNLERFEPAALIREVQDIADVLAQEKGLALNSCVEDSVPGTVIADRRLLHQILVNLVGNAVKFTEEGAVQIRAHRLDEDHWALEVTDTGGGIPEEARSRIFEPFELAEDPVTRRHAGAGLGLSIVKQMVTLMGGEIALSSEVGEGSVFTIIVPLKPDAHHGAVPLAGHDTDTT